MRMAFAALLGIGIGHRTSHELTGQWSDTIIPSTYTVGSSAEWLSTGAGTAAGDSGKAVGYRGPPLTEMTICWLGEITSVYPNVYGGIIAGILDTPSGSTFNAIAFGWGSVNRLEAVSENRLRYSPFDLDLQIYVDLKYNSRVDVCVLWENIGNGAAKVTRVVDGTEFGTFTKGTLPTFGPNSQMWWATGLPGGAGAFSAKYMSTTIWNRKLTVAEIIARAHGPVLPAKPAWPATVAGYGGQTSNYHCGPIVDYETCDGLAAGTYTIAGMPGVYCDGNGWALLQNTPAPCVNTPEVNAVTPGNCGYHHVDKVTTLAWGAQKVKLRTSNFEIESTAAVAPLQSPTGTWNGLGGSWTLLSGTAPCWSCNLCHLMTGWPVMLR